MEIIREISQMKKPTSIAVGFFDGVHIGHREVLNGAVSFDGQGLVPMAFTFPQKSLKMIKNTAGYILNDRMKCERMGSLGIKTVIMPDFDAVKDISAEDFVRDILIGRLCAKAIVCGYNYRFGAGGAGDLTLLKRLCEENGVTCKAIPQVKLDGEPVSSSKIREYLKAGEIEKANRLLAEEYCFDFKVITGARLGRTLGFPTINQEYDGDYALPRFGVYMSKVSIGGREYKGVTNIGVKPTVSDKGIPSAETHIIGINENLYGENIKVKLLSFLREEKRFSSVEELKAEATKNIQTVEKTKI